MLLELIFNKPTNASLFNRAAGEGPPTTNDERELVNKFSHRDNNDVDSTSHTRAPIVEEILNRLTKNYATTSTKYKPKI